MASKIDKFQCQGTATMVRRAGPNAQISEGLEKLTRTNAKLDRMLAKIGTKADNADFRSTMTKERHNATKTCKVLMALFKETQDSNPELLQRFTAEFKKQMNKFQDISQAIESREQEVIMAISSSKDGGGDGAAGGRRSSDGQLDMEIDIQFLDYDAEEIKRRQDGIQAIERDLLEISEMFTDLNSLVNEQSDMLDMVENNISAARARTEHASEQLRQAEALQQKSRKRNCCILLIVMACLALVVLGVAVVQN